MAISQVLGIADKASAVKVRNVLSPLLWLIAICVPVATTGLITGPAQFAWIFATLLLLPIFTAIFAYGYFAIKDPQRLQSEEYLLKEAELRIWSKRGEITDPLELKPVPLDSPTLIESEAHRGL